MNLSDIWDWTFLWQMVRNNALTGAPFVMVFVGVSIALTLLGGIVAMIRKGRSD